MPIDHEFSDQHTELKLSIVEKYLKFFTTALRGKFNELWYVDAFAGTGSRTVRHEERAAVFWTQESLKGSSVVVALPELLSM